MQCNRLVCVNENYVFNRNTIFCIISILNIIIYIILFLLKMSDIEDIIMSPGPTEGSCKKDFPAVPTPDWSVQNFKDSLNRKTIEIPVINAVTENLNEMKKTVTDNASSSNNSITMEIPQRMHKPVNVENANAAIPSTPTHSISTPSYNSINPHSTMTAATPAAASGVNQAINSIKLQNCVSTVNVGCELELLDIYCKTRYSEYNPQRFQGVVMKLMDPRATALIFRSGKIVCTGARNEYDSYIAARKFARIIERLGFPAKFLDFKIQNFCATADLKFPIRLEALQQAHGQFASYEPELFPGLVYRMVRPRVVLLIFVNGKIVFTGGKNRNEITEALEIIYPILRGYRIS